MRRWLTLGALVLLAAWAPFLYAELTSERVAQKDAPVASDPFDQPTDDPELAVAGGEAQAAAPGADDEGEEADEDEQAAEAEATPDDERVEESGEAHAVATPESAKAAEAVAPTTPSAPREEDDDEPAPVPPQGSSHATVVLRRAFESEPRDALWAREAEASLLQIFSGAQVPSSAIHAARCQKTVCKLDLVWSAEYADAYLMAYETVRQRFGNDVGVQPAGSGNYDDEMRLDLYVPRQGYTLADLSR